MATKKQIINDWQKIFPELKKQGSISLDNRLGPLITGIYIKVVRNTYYTPIFYVHNLCREYSSITTSLQCGKMCIRDSFKGSAETRYRSLTELILPGTALELKLSREWNLSLIHI